jgi:hypothetical protein
MDQLVAATLDAYDAKDEWVAGLRAGLGTLLRLLAERPEVARLCFVEVLGGGAPAIQARDEAMAQLSRLFLPDAKDGGDPPPDLLPLALAGGLSEVIYRAVTTGRTASLPDQLPDLLYLTVLPLRGAEAARAAIEEDSP